MRKVELRLNEEEKFTTIKKLVETNGNKEAAAIRLGCSRRHIDRMIRGYREQGKAFFLHGNRNRTPANKVDQSTREDVANLYVTKYEESNFTHFTELLAEMEEIDLSCSTVRTILMEKGLLSPMATKKTKRNLKKLLEARLELTSSSKEQAQLKNQIVELDLAHPRRARKAHFGELIQMDASTTCWFGGQKSYLHLAVDDCTGAIVGAWFDAQETLNGYYQVLRQILSDYGIPYRFLTDRRTVFEYVRKESSRLENDTFTQFGYACKQLGIDIRTTSTPQTKGRVERMFRTLKSRLLTELRLEGATTTEQANEFLNHYVKKFNDRFALTIDYTTSVFESSPSAEKVNLILAVLTRRKIDSGHCLRFQNRFYQPVDAAGIPLHYRRGTSCMVIQALDGSLYTAIGEQVYALDWVPEHTTGSSEFGVQTPPVQTRKRYVPPMSHPWKAKTFEDHVKAQHHYQEKVLPPFEEVIYSQEIFY